LIVLFEATTERQNRFMRTVAMAMGAEIEESPSSSSSEKTYQKPWRVDPTKGVEITPAFVEEEINKLPISLGYSIIGGEE
jgi:hypothetical protein